MNRPAGPAVFDLALTPPPAHNLDLTRVVPLGPPEAGRPTDRPADRPTGGPGAGPWGPAQMPAVGETFAGFRLTAELGTGAFGRVFLAEQTALAGRPVALKVTTRPTPEPQRLAKLRHTNVVPIYSVHDEFPLQAVCMPYLGRRTLADLVKEYRRTGSFPGSAAPPSTARAAAAPTDGPGARPPAARPAPAPGPAEFPAPAEVAGASHPDLVAWVVARLADGLAHAHEAGILHLDIKPANVLLADDGHPLLLDFNLAFDVRAGARDRAGGTLPYMAPEQLDEYQDGGPTRVDHRTDLYALGVVFFELLTGRHPFPLTPGRRPDPADMARARRAGPPAVRAANPAVSPAVEAVVKKLLAPAPADRYQAARDLAADLDRHRRHLPLAFAPNPSARERARKWRRRNPRALTAGALAAAVLAAGGLGAAAVRQAEARAAADAAGQARQAADLLPGLRVDLTAPANPDTRAKGLARARAVLAGYGLPDDPGWAARPAVRALPDAARAELADRLGELALLAAHAEWLNGRGRPADEPAAADRALALNRAAEGCYPQGPPAAVARQRAWVAGGPAPGPDGETPVDLFLRAATEMADGRYKAAIPLLEDLTTRDPGHAAGQFALGLCRHEAGDYPRALERYQMARAVGPADPRPAFNRGVIFILQARYREAEAEFADALRRAPADAPSYHHRGLARARLGDLPGAAADLSRALDLGAPPFRVRLLRADVLARLGDPAAAARDREAAAALTPATAEDLVARGISRLRADPTAALADFVRAAELNPKYLPAWQNQAHVLSDVLDQPAKALDAQDQAVACSPEFVSSRIGRAVLLARLGRKAEARADADRALALSADPGVLYQAACTYALIGAGGDRADRDRAVDLIRRAFLAGYRRFGELDADPDLAGVRALPEFQALVRAARELAR